MYASTQYEGMINHQNAISFLISMNKKILKPYKVLLIDVLK